MSSPKPKTKRDLQVYAVDVWTASDMHRHGDGILTPEMKVLWDNTPAHRGEAVQDCLAAPGPGIQLMNQPRYTPDFNTDKPARGWTGEGSTGNLCLGTAAFMQSPPLRRYGRGSRPSSVV